MTEILVSVAGAAATVALPRLVDFFLRPPSDLDLDERLSRELQTMQAFLRDTEGVDGLTEVTKNLVVNIRDLAYDIEDAVDKFLLDVPQNLHQHRVTKARHQVAHPLGGWRARCHLSEAVNKLDPRIKQMASLASLVRIPPAPVSSPVSSTSAFWYLQQGVDQLVGIDTRSSKLAGAILEGGPNSSLAVISVVGPRGSGKTTVLKQVFKNLNGEFKQCVWIDVQSATNFMESVVAAVRASRWRRSIPQHKSDEDKLAYLLKKRYALFIDGILRKADCTRLMSLLPDHNKGSRVIVAAHEQDATSYPSRLESRVYEVECLTCEESWRLLCMIAFPGGECPAHSRYWTEMLLKRCEGLPVAVVALGRHLSTIHQKSPEEFKKLHDSLGHELLGDADLSIVGRIWLQNYNNLPHNKRCCFLHFSNFPEDYSVTRGRLIRLWIAENFVKDESGMSLEEEAERYLNELIQKDLVVITRRDFEGNVRSCRVKNLVLQFILSKSDKEEFCSVLPRSNKASGDKIRRLALHRVGTGAFLKRVNLSGVRSLMMFTSDKLSSKLLKPLRYLKVLDLEDAKLEDFPKEIAKLKLLKHLSLRNTDVKKIPKSIENLQSLVTLDLRQTLITNLPKEINKLKQLVCLLINHRTMCMEGVEVVPGIKQLVSLRKMSLVKADRKNWDRFAEELKSMTELRKLGISGLKSEDGKALCESLVGMTNLYSLQVISATRQELLDLDSIGVKMPCPIRSLLLAGSGLPCWISSLHSLAKLRLQWSRLRASQLETLGGLPCLVELKLADGAYAEANLVVKAGWFGKLKMLQLEGLSMLERVEVNPGAMPLLTSLVTRSCPRLDVILGVLRTVLDSDRMEEIRKRD